MGLTEQFDESLILIKRELNWKTPFYRKQNVVDSTSKCTFGGA